jgi:hypothetical protein
LKSPAWLRHRTWLAAAALMAGAGVWFAPLATMRGSILIWPGARYSDLLTSHWASAAYIHRMLLAWHTIPLWNESILGGLPLASDPLSGIWYPPNWLALLFPASWAFYLLLGAHLAWGGAGLYRLLRQLGARPLASLIGGLAFSGMPGIIGHMALGHFSLVCAVSWTPWLLAGARNAAMAIAGAARRWGASAANVGIIWGLVFLVDPRWSIPAGLLMAGYALFSFWKQSADTHDSGGGRPMARAVGGALLIGGSAFGLSAVLFLPLVELTEASARSLLTVGEAQGVSLSPAGLLQLIAPVFGAWPETVLYSGFVVFLLALAALVGGEGEANFLGIAALGSVVLAMGGQTPAYRWIAALVPGMSLLRVPARFALLAGFCLCMLGGLGAERLARRFDRSRSYPTFNLAIVGLVAAGLLLAASLAFAAPGGWVGRYAIWAALVMAAGFWALAGSQGRVNSDRLLGGMVVLLLIDLGLVNFTLVVARPGPTLDGTMASRVQAANSLAAGGRAFSPAYSLEQPLAAIQGLRLADGIDPLQLMSYRDFMAEAVGFPAQGYSVTLPPYPNGDPAEPQKLKLDAERLGVLDISLVASTYPLDQPGLEWLGFYDGAYFYRNPLARGEAWLQDVPGEPVEAWHAVEVDQVTPDRVAVRVAGPGRLVFSEVAYPGWMARLDGQPIALETERGLLRAVQLPPARHLVELIYRPTSLIAGGLITLLTLCLWLALGRQA